MNNKLQELTDKIYAEGVEKGKNEAATIVANAQAEAEKIIADAQANATKIVEKATIEAEDLDKKSRSELRLFANQSVSALQTEITNLINDKVINESVKAATVDAEFMKSIILKIAESWSNSEGVVIEAEDAAALETYFKANAKSILDKGIEIKEVKGLKTNFTISPADGGYKIKCGEEEFVAYFKEFLRAKLIELLF